MSHVDGLTGGLRGSKVGSSLAGITRWSPQTFSSCVVVTARHQLDKSSSLDPGADVKTHTPEAWVSVFFSPSSPYLFSSSYILPHLFWVSAFNCLAALWWTDAVTVLQYEGSGSTSALSELIKSGWLCLIGHWGWIAVGCRSDVVFDHVRLSLCVYCRSSWSI